MDVILGAGLGLAYAAAPGPVTIATVRQGLAGGARAALWVQLGATAGRAAYAGLALAGAGLALAHGPASTLLGLCGASLLVASGGSSLREGWAGLRRTARRGTGAWPAGAPRSAASPGRAALSGATLALANPLTVAFWLSLGGTLLRPGAHAPALILGGFFGAGIAWSFTLALLVGRVRPAPGGRVVPLLSVACGLALLLFGLGLGRTAARSLTATLSLGVVPTGCRPPCPGGHTRPASPPGQRGHPPGPGARGVGCGTPLSWTPVMVSWATRGRDAARPADRSAVAQHGAGAVAPAPCRCLSRHRVTPTARSAGRSPTLRGVGSARPRDRAV